MIHMTSRTVLRQKFGKRLNADKSTSLYNVLSRSKQHLTMNVDIHHFSKVLRRLGNELLYCFNGTSLLDSTM